MSSDPPDYVYEHAGPFEATREIYCTSVRNIIKICCFEKLQDALLNILNGWLSSETKCWRAHAMLMVY
jgi:hypothetical protein